VKNALFGSGIKTVFTIVVVALVALGGVAAAYATGVLGSATPTLALPSAPPSPSPLSATSAPAATAPADTIVVPRPVTTGLGIPSASPIHDAQFTSATSGWVLAMYDAGTYDSAHQPVPGQRILYLISPGGERYEVGTFAADEQADLAAWNVAQGKVLLELGGSHYAVFDIATNTLGPTWALCGPHPVTAFITPQDDGTWEFRGYCIGAQVDGVYSDTGADVTPADFYRAPFERWDVDLEKGAVAIYWSDAQVPSILISFPHSDEPTELFWPSGVDSCVPLGVGRLNTGDIVSSIAIACNSGEHVSAWEEDDRSIDPIQIAISSTVEAFSASTLGGGVPMIDKNCVVGNREVLEIQSVGRAAVFVDNGNLSQPSLTPTTGAEHCWGSSGDVGLFSGHGSLWTTTFGGAPTPLVEVSGKLQPGEPIGVALTRSLIAP
jgi:hypothetical protein